MEYVVVVDAANHEMGHEEKLQAHVTPSLHRACSVFLFNAAGAMLLQRRADEKYHSPGLWSNACCGHPRPGEAAALAAERRLREEMGIACSLLPAGTVTYAIDVGRGLHEHEYNHVYVGAFDGQPTPDPREVADWQWIGAAALRRAVRDTPASLTAWFPIVFRHIEESVTRQPTLFPAMVQQLWKT
jgi:isopentenyl-diphosphate delta-isomerase